MEESKILESLKRENQNLKQEVKILNKRLSNLHFSASESLKYKILDYAEKIDQIDYTFERLQFMVTTYCELFDIEADTYDYDNFIYELYERYKFNNKEVQKCKKYSFEWFDNYICKYIV